MIKEKLVVLGGGESGVGAAVLGMVKGFDVWLSDNGTIAPHYKEIIDKYHIPYEEGGHTEEKVLAANQIVKSPGIADTTPLVAKAIAKGIPVISEIEFAGKFTHAKMVCITGSNGKTTTTKLTHHILRKAGINAGIAGNVGNSLALQVATEDHDVYVVELSSYQLDNMYDFKAHIAVLLNVTPDHMERYHFRMEEYAASKFRITQNQGPDDAFIFWQDDPVIQSQLKVHDLHSRLLPFSDNDGEDIAAWIGEDALNFRLDGETWQLPREEMVLKGRHNMYNSMAAGLSAKLLGVKNDVIRAAMADFQAVPHRLQYVDTVNGVRYIDDSKATNVNACWYALESVNEPIVLILGGIDKGNDYNEILPLIQQKVKALVFLGADNSILHKFFDDKVENIADTHSMTACVEACRQFAEPGTTVLLSPCCASFDLFKNMGDRGDQFKAAVATL